MTVGVVAQLWRYPVKSMLGERLEAAEVTARGLAGDRAYALLDVESGRGVSAKIPRHRRGGVALRGGGAGGGGGGARPPRPGGRGFGRGASSGGEPSPEGLSPALVTFPDGSSM